MASAAYSVAVMRIGASRLFTQLTHRRNLGVDLLEAGTDGLQQALACLCRGYTAGGASKKPHAKTRLKLANGVAEGGLRHAQLRGGLREAAFPANDQESEKVIEVATLHLSLHVISPFGL